mmetsp:Transcript_49560/g.105315  ORF Transcript_49560/g.105315 Transcript_49560/m.105315 type:complete len:289 (-) Transcript_49560:1771-2637(-)
MERHAQRAQPLRRRVTPQHLHRNDQRIPHQVAVHGRVEDVHGPVVAGAGHQRPTGVEPHGPQRPLVVLERLVGRGRQVQVEPDESSVEAARHDVIAGGVHVQRGDVTAPRQESLDHDLLHQVIHPDVLLGRHEQEGLLGVEARQLRLAPLGLAEGLLRRRLGELVDEDGGRAGLRGDGGEVVALPVPLDGGDVLVGAKEGYGSGLAPECTDRRSGRFLVFSKGPPRDGLGGARIGSDVPPLLARRSSGEQRVRDLRIVQPAGSCGYDDGTLPDSGKEDVVGSIGIPLQ